jgi:hypothetical protein
VWKIDVDETSALSFEDVDTWERLCGGPRKSVRDVRYGSLADIGEGYQGCPLYPQKRTCSSSASMSAMCQKQTLTISDNRPALRLRRMACAAQVSSPAFHQSSLIFSYLSALFPAPK